MHELIPRDETRFERIAGRVLSYLGLPILWTLACVMLSKWPWW